MALLEDKNSCPWCECGVITTMEIQEFEYVTPKALVALRTGVPVVTYTCPICDFSYTNHTAEMARTQAVDDFLAEHNKQSQIPKYRWII